MHPVGRLNSIKTLVPASAQRLFRTCPFGSVQIRQSITILLLSFHSLETGADTLLDPKTTYIAYEISSWGNTYPR